MKTLNKFLIRCLEKHQLLFREDDFRNKQTSLNSILLSFAGFGISGIFIYAFIKHWSNLISEPWILSIIYMYLGLNLLSSIKNRDFLDGFLTTFFIPYLCIVCYLRIICLSLHVFLPGYQLRNNEVMAFHIMRSEISRQKLDALNAKDRAEYEAKKTLLEKKIELAETDFELFMNEYLPKSQSLKRFLRERIKDEEGKTNYFLVLLILSLPIEKLSTDAIKFIVLSAIQHKIAKDVLIKNFGILPQAWDFIQHRHLLNKLYGEASEEQIKYWFTKTYSVSDYCAVLKTYFVRHRELNLQAKNIKDLVDGLPRKLNHDFSRLEASNQGFVYRVMKKKSDYVNAKHDFKNCVLSYFDREDVDIVCVYDKETPIACVSVDHYGKVIEIAAPYNNGVSGNFKEIIINTIRSSIRQDTLKTA